jgi:DnaJ-class molecular chaperone
MLPDLYPCHACHGRGEIVSAMSYDEQRARGRYLRRCKAQGVAPDPIDYTCKDCAGSGYTDAATWQAHYARTQREHDAKNVTNGT